MLHNFQGIGNDEAKSVEQVVLNSDAAGADRVLYPTCTAYKSKSVVLRITHIPCEPL